jgi:hypothetical protein
MKSRQTASFSSLHLHEGEINSDTTKTRRRVVAAILALTTLATGCSSSKPTPANKEPTSTNVPVAESTSTAKTTPIPETQEITIPNSTVPHEAPPLVCPITAAQAHEITGAPANLLQQAPAEGVQVICQFGAPPEGGQPKFLDFPTVGIIGQTKDDFDVSLILSQEPNASSTFKYVPEFGAGAWATYHTGDGNDTEIQMPLNGQFISVAVYEPAGFHTSSFDAASRLAQLVFNEK